ncbi:hypothetical protein [Salicibibacter kimchii]|uniref:hypothetical protein n=1 Tax=Salicibibacter kimchii TaxID=2099786 RepID=UPI001D0557ED|nr:hypothetical protein [Salicibibacter kimchii]
MTTPEGNIGLICRSLEKYYDTRAGEMKVKRRPVLIIGCEDDYIRPKNVDYELVYISTLPNKDPHPTYDYPVLDDFHIELGLDRPSYIRTHKHTWNHAKFITYQDPISDLGREHPELFKEILNLNTKWMEKRNYHSMYCVGFNK